MPLNNFGNLTHTINKNIYVLSYLLKLFTTTITTTLTDS